MSRLFSKICQPLYERAHKLKYPNFPHNAIGKLTITGTSTNKLEKRIVTFIQLHGWNAERIKNTGTARIEKIKMPNGYTKSNVNYTKGTGTNGTADISATINGKSVKIEVKNVRTKDRMSKAQRLYKEQIEMSGGVYFVATEIDEFINWFNSRYKINPNWDTAVLHTFYKK